MTAAAFDIELEQAKRTASAHNALQQGLFEIDQLDANTWLVKNGDGGPYTIQHLEAENWLCDCMDFAERGAKYGLRCKHVEGVKQWLNKDEAPERVLPGAVAVGPSVVVEYKHTTQHDGDFFSFGLQPNIPLNPDGTLNLPLASRIIDSGIEAYPLVQKQVESLLKAKIAERVAAKQLHQLLQPVYTDLRKLGVPPADIDEALALLGGKPETLDKTAVDVLLAKLLAVAKDPPFDWRWQAPAPAKPKGKTGPLNPAQMAPPPPPPEPTPPPADDAEVYAAMADADTAAGNESPAAPNPAPSPVDLAKCVTLHLTPKNAALQGKTLGELMGMEEGQAVIKYLATGWKPKNGGTEQDQKLQAAAKVLVQHNAA